MKNILLLMMFMIITVISYSQAKQDFSGYKIFINPGHGGYDSDDRHMLETDVWESECNLMKGFYLRDIMKNMNATVYMSRTTNTTADDLNLSVISTMANSANVDFFLSIHSNGYAGTQNVPLMLFKGYTESPAFPAAKTMAQIMWQKLYDNGNCWTSTTVWVAGDWTFYPDWGTQGLGVLRGLTMPGVLSEGAFHDYIPEGWRMRNKDFLHRESWALARSFIDYNNVKPFDYGIIVGVIRDPLRSPTYYFKAGTKDEAIPLNGGTVTLKPGNLTYKVDTLNNGFFMFDSIAPGNYKLYFDGIKNYMKDSLDITVIANKTNFADKNLKYDTTQVPKLISILPLITDSLSLNQEFTFTFDLAMNTDSVQKALVSNPAVKHIYTWLEKNTILKVKPETNYIAKTNYTITLSTIACSKWKVKIAAPAQLKFVTKNRINLRIEKNYPQKAQTNVSLYPQIRFVFDAPINQASANANIQILDDTNAALSKVREEYSVKDGKGNYFFELTNPLKVNKTYRIILNSSLMDDIGMKLPQATEISFTTRKSEYETGTVIEAFDDISRFWDPNASGSTKYTDDQATTFTSAFSKRMGGSAAGMLNYQFTNPGEGVCRVFNQVKPSVGQDLTKKFGVWVYGDLSYNALEYWFYSADGSNQIVIVDTIDWAGWDFKTIPMNKIGGSGDRLFHSVVITQTPEGVKQGIIYFDQAQLFFPLAINNQLLSDKTLKVSNYPNPFTDKNTVSFYLPHKSHVKLEVFTIFGQKIERLFEGDKDSGLFSLEWAPSAQLEKGIYFYRIELKSGVNKQTTVNYSKCVFIGWK